MYTKPLIPSSLGELNSEYCTQIFAEKQEETLFVGDLTTCWGNDSSGSINF